MLHACGGGGLGHRRRQLLPECFASSLRDTFITSRHWEKIPGLSGDWKKFGQRLLRWNRLVGFLRGLVIAFDVDAPQPNDSEISGVLLLMLNLLCKTRHGADCFQSHGAEFTTKKPCGLF